MSARPLVRAAAAAATALAAHSAVNVRLLRRPPASARRSVAAAVRPADGAAAQGAGARVSVLLPVRDEVERVRPCLEALLAQDLAGMEVVVLDDGSTDGTADVVREVAAGDPVLRLLDGTPPPPGWLGKPHACQQLADGAAGDVLVFIDADVVLQPRGLAAAVALLSGSAVGPCEPLDIVSPYPRQEAEGAAVRLVQPLLQWSWLTFLPLRLAERLPAPSLTAANGQLLVCRAHAYRRAGGHAAVRTEVLEDVALARAAKAAGLRVGMADGSTIATCRMYGTWAELRDGYGKSLWAAFGSPGRALAVAVLLAWLYLVPPSSALAALLRPGPPRRRLVAALPGLVGTASAVGGRAVCASVTGARVADAAAHPASIGVLLWLVSDSWRRHRRGDLTWRGRPVTVPERALRAQGGGRARDVPPG